MSQLSLFGNPATQSAATHAVIVRSHLRRVKGSEPTVAIPAPDAPHNGTATSRSAATQITGSGKASVLRERVFAAIAASGERGVTRADLEVICSIDGNTLRPRVWELLGNGGFEARIIEDGEKRRPDCKPGSMRQSVLRVALDIAETDRLQ